ncbi:beta-microseminoprotein-like isoform 2-T3 [Anomaloglossus baeobatrachus]
MALLLGSSFLATLCNGTCLNRDARLSNLGETPDGCMDDGIKKALNSTWFKDVCMKCSCGSAGDVECCSRKQEPIMSNKACEAILDKTSCTYTIHKKDNYSGPCEILAYM